MTRINIIPCKLLLDQHLIAEKKEINQLIGQINKSLQSKNWHINNNIPNNFTLGTGHCKFFYNKIKYLDNRFKLIDEEISKRYNKEYNSKFYNILNNNKELYNDFIPNKKDQLIIIERLKSKIIMKPNYYLLNKRKINKEEYFEILDNFYNSL